MSQILLVGRPNSGKTYLYNTLTSSHEKTGNFSGVTVEKSSYFHKDWGLTFVDLPGLTSFKSEAKDEKITLKTLQDSSPEDLICITVDILKFRNQIDYLIELILWCKKHLKPTILCLNMSDEADKNHISINEKNISQILGIPVFKLSAKKRVGLSQLLSFLKHKQWSPPKVKDTNFHILHHKILNSLSYKNKVFVRTDEQFDRIFLSPFLGPVCFLFLTLIIFQSIFSWATPLMNLIENSISHLASLTTPLFSGIWASLVENIVFSGFGAFLVFTPQIFVLTFILTALESSGYMTRATLLCHQPLKFFGLHGQSFIPLMTGHACALPAIYATRSIENPWIRKLTLCVIPLMACSARIPIYALLIKLLVPEKYFLGFSLQGFFFFLMYFFGISMALIVSFILTVFSQSKPPNQDFIIELPKYRHPEWFSLIRKSLETTWNFIKDAGPIIFLLNAILWALSYFPHGKNHFEHSYLAQMGQWIEPVFTPMGLSWIEGVAVLSSFIAREVFISTWALLNGLQTDDIHEVLNLENVQNLSMASGISLLIFFAIALQMYEHGFGYDQGD